MALCCILDVLGTKIGSDAFWPAIDKGKMRAHIAMQGGHVAGTSLPVDVGFEVAVEILVGIEFRTVSRHIFQCDEGLV